MHHIALVQAVCNQSLLVATAHTLSKSSASAITRVTGQELACQWDISLQIHIELLLFYLLLFIYLFIYYYLVELQMRFYPVAVVLQ
jgi:hypothetical protein